MYSGGLHLTLLYRPAETISSAIAQAAQYDLAKIGVRVKLLGVPDADFYTKYLEVPAVARHGGWDMAVAGWGPDWYGDAALSYFGPLLSGPGSFPPDGSNFGFYSDPAVTALIGQGATAGSAELGRPDLGPGGPEGHAGRPDLPHHQPAASRTTTRATSTTRSTCLSSSSSIRPTCG